MRPGPKTKRNVSTLHVLGFRTTLRAEVAKLVDEYMGARFMGLPTTDNSGHTYPLEARRDTWADKAGVLRSPIRDRKPITVDNQRRRAFFRLTFGKSKRGSGSFSSLPSALGLVLKKLRPAKAIGRRRLR
jgi:hypothetical protein